MSRVLRFKEVDTVARGLFQERIIKLEKEVSNLKEICDSLAGRLTEVEIQGLVGTPVPVSPKEVQVNLNLVEYDAKAPQNGTRQAESTG